MVYYSIGDCINDRYKVESVLGRGATSEVYKVYDKRLGRYLGSKLLKRDYVNNYATIAKFKNEANILSKLSHPNIISIFDIYFSESLTYYTTEYLEGMDLAAYIRNTKNPSVSFVFEVLKQTLEGTAFLHGEKIIHRDIKPTNIFLVNSNINEGDKIAGVIPLVKLLDFGVIKT